MSGFQNNIKNNPEAQLHSKEPCRRRGSPCSTTPSDLRAISIFCHLFACKWMMKYSVQIAATFFQWCNITWSLVWRKNMNVLNGCLENPCLLFTFDGLCHISSTTLFSSVLLGANERWLAAHAMRLFSKNNRILSGVHAWFLSHSFLL